MKCFYIDIDGVFYRNGKTNKNLIKTILTNNNEYFFCTGRGYDRAMSIISPYVDNTKYIIIENGSKIVDIFGNIIYKKELTKKEKNIILEIDSKSIEYILFNPIGTDKYIVYGKIESDFIGQIVSSYEDFCNIVMKNKMTQITIKFNNNKSTNYKKFIKEGINVKMSDNYLTINHFGVSKKTAIKYINKLMNKDEKNTIVIGNDYNDIEMFKLHSYKKIVVKTFQTPKELISLSTDVVKFETLNDLVAQIKS